MTTFIPYDPLLGVSVLGAVVVTIILLFTPGGKRLDLILFCLVWGAIILLFTYATKEPEPAPEPAPPVFIYCIPEGSRPCPGATL